MTLPMIRGLRGATTCSVDSVEEIADATQELLRAMMERNAIDHDDVVSVIFTTTPDLTAAFPATSARDIGFGDIPLMCASEIAVPGSMPRCIRVLIHAYTALDRAQLRHVYLRHAQSLRDDLPG
jgi:chorismate mutase